MDEEANETAELWDAIEKAEMQAYSCKRETGNEKCADSIHHVPEIAKVRSTGVVITELQPHHQHVNRNSSSNFNENNFTFGRPSTTSRDSFNVVNANYALKRGRMDECSNPKNNANVGKTLIMHRPVEDVTSMRPIASPSFAQPIYRCSRQPSDSWMPNNWNVEHPYQATGSNCRWNGQQGMREMGLEQFSGGEVDVFPSLDTSVHGYKECQQAALNLLEPSDFMALSGGKKFIKKSGWRKMAFFFGISFEIKDRTIERDSNTGMVLSAEFIVKAVMRNGRFSDGWGSCHRSEKKFSKPNHDIPSTAETRAKSRACQDLLGIGDGKPGT